MTQALFSVIGTAMTNTFMLARFDHRLHT